MVYNASWYDSAVVSLLEHKNSLLQKDGYQ